jgi:hypothetical protein
VDSSERETKPTFPVADTTSSTRSSRSLKYEEAYVRKNRLVAEARALIYDYEQSAKRPEYRMAAHLYPGLKYITSVFSAITALLNRELCPTPPE